MRRSLAVFIVLILFSLSLPRQASRAQTFRPVVRGTRGVVAGGHPLSVEAGLRILQTGGNAVDAGVATILAASVIEFSHFSFGGEVPILIKLRGTSPAMRNRSTEVAVTEGVGRAPVKAPRVSFATRATTADKGTTADSSKGRSAGSDLP